MITDKIRKYAMDKRKQGEKPPYIMVLSQEEVLELKNHVTGYHFISDKTHTELEKVMLKVPYMVGRVDNVYLIESNINKNREAIRQLAIEAIETMISFFQIRLSGEEIISDKLKINFIGNVLTWYLENKDKIQMVNHNV